MRRLRGFGFRGYCRRGGIDAKLHAERASEFELLGEFLLADDLGTAP
jgi:hypothetical protein